MPWIPHSERVSFAHVLDLWCQSWLLEVWGFPSLFVVICYFLQVNPLAILWSSEVIVRVLCSALVPRLPCVVRYHANEQLSWPCVLYMNEINFFVLSNLDFLKTIPSFPFQMDDGVCIFELDSSLMCMMPLVAKGKCYKLTMFFFLFSWFVMCKHVVSMDLTFTLWIASHRCFACFMPWIPHSERVSFAHVLDLWCQSWLLEVWGFPSLFVVICYFLQVNPLAILWSSEVIVRVLCSALVPRLPCVVRYHANEQLSWPCVLYMNEINFFVLSNLDFLKTIPSFPFQMDDGVCIFELDSSLMCMMPLVAKGKCYKLTMFFFLFSWFVMCKHVVSMDLSFTLWISSHSCCACFMPRIPHSERRISFAHVLDLWCQSWLLEVWGFPSLFVVICYHRQVSAHCVICSKNMQHLKALCGHFRDLTDSSVVSCPDVFYLIRREGSLEKDLLGLVGRPMLIQSILIQTFFFGKLM